MQKLRNIVFASIIAVGLTGTGLGIGLATAQTTRPAGRGAERHPEIRRALTALRNAKTALEEGAHDFKGHRVAALKATETAIQEAETCLKVDAD